MALTVPLSTILAEEDEEERRKRERREAQERTYAAAKSFLTLFGEDRLPEELGQLRDQARLMRLDRGYQEAVEGGAQISPDVYADFRGEYEKPGMLARTLNQATEQGFFSTGHVTQDKELLRRELNRAGSLGAIAAHLSQRNSIPLPDYFQMVSEVERAPDIGATMDALETMDPKSSEWSRFGKALGGEVLETLALPERTLAGTAALTGESLRPLIGRETGPGEGWQAVRSFEDVLAAERRAMEMAPEVVLPAEIAMGLALPAGGFAKAPAMGKRGRELFTLGKALGVGAEEVDLFLKVETKIATMKVPTPKEYAAWAKVNQAMELQEATETAAKASLGEMVEEVAPRAGREVEVAVQNLAEAGVTPIAASDDPVQTVINLLRKAEEIRPDVVEARAAEGARRGGQINSIATSARYTPEQKLPMIRAAQRGAMPSGSLEPFLQQVPETQLRVLRERIYAHAPWARMGQAKANADEALMKMLGGGELPAPWEQKLLTEVFGPDFGKAIDVARRAGPDIWGNLIQAANIPRTILASYDLSAPLRQGIMLAPGHPLIFAQNTARMIRIWAPEAVEIKLGIKGKQIIRTPRVKAPRWLGPVGEEAMKVRYDAMKVNPRYESAIANGLYQTSEAVRGAEEAMLGARYIRGVPGVGQAERAYNTFLDSLRFDVYDSVMKNWEVGGKVKIGEGEDLARFINYATGRGSFGPTGNRLAPFASTLAFSPRFTISRPQAFGKMIFASHLTRGQAIRDMGLFIGANMTLLGLLKFTGAADVEINPRSSDFLKAKIGPTRIDLWGGAQPYARYAAQAALGERKSGGGNVYDVNRMKVLGRLGWSKLSPQAGLIVDLLIGSTFIGDDMTLSRSGVQTQFLNRLAPMAWQDLYDAITLQGPIGILMASPAFLGVGVQSYETLYDELRREQQVAMAALNYTDDDLENNRAKRIQVNEQPNVQEILKKLDEDITQHGGTPQQRLSTNARTVREKAAQAQIADDFRFRDSTDPRRGDIWRRANEDRKRETWAAIQYPQEYEGVEWEEEDWPTGTVDEALDRYYGVELSEFITEEGLYDWDSFYAARDAAFIDLNPEQREEALQVIRRFWTSLEWEMWEKEQKVQEYLDLPETVYQREKERLGLTAPTMFAYRNEVYDLAGKEAVARGQDPLFGMVKPILRKVAPRYLSLQKIISRDRERWRRKNRDGTLLLLELGFKDPSAVEARRYRGTTEVPETETPFSLPQWMEEWRAP